MRFLITTILIVSGIFLKAQVKIENIDFKYQNDKILVNYDLSGDGIYLADLYYTKNNGNTWHGPLDNIKGDIYGVTSGKSKCITYHILKEHSRFVAKNLRFKILITRCSGTFIDSRDSTEYKWTRIGRQTWMAENLKATKYTDGTTIPLVKRSFSWHYLCGYDKAYCWYENDSWKYNKYGVLYNWAAATNMQGNSNNNPSGIQGVCPDGWHLPSETEWIQLEEFIKHKHLYIDVANKSVHNYSGKCLKSKNGWKDKGNGSDDFNFNGLPGGERCSLSFFIDEGKESHWWSTTIDAHYSIIYRGLEWDSENIINKSDDRSSGFYVRCIKN